MMISSCVCERESWCVCVSVFHIERFNFREFSSRPASSDLTLYLFIKAYSPQKKQEKNLKLQAGCRSKPVLHNYIQWTGLLTLKNTLLVLLIIRARATAAH